MRAIGDELDESGIKPARKKRLFDDAHDSFVGGIGVAAAAQHHGVAALDAKSHGIRRHVGARLIDDAHHAEGHSHTRDIQPVLRRVPLDDLADGAGKAHERFEPLRDIRDALFVEHQTVAELLPARACGNVLSVCRNNFGSMRNERLRRQRKHSVLVCLRRIGDRTRMLLGKAAGLGNRHNTLSFLQIV